MLLLAGAMACGGSSTLPEPGEFTPEHAQLFDDGVDLIEDPDALQGAWKSDFEIELDRRAAEADLIVSGKITTLRVEQDPEQRSTFHLLFHNAVTMKGETSESELALASREGAAGYGSVQQHGERLLERNFVAFIRYARDETGARVAHFHLSVPSPLVTQTVERRDAKDNPHRVQVIEHTQK